MTNASKYPRDWGPHLWEISGSLRTRLFRCDGQTGEEVDSEKNAVNSAMVSGAVTGQIERFAPQMGLGSGDGANGTTSSAIECGSVKPGFTRKAGSFRRQALPRGVRGPGR